MAKYKSLDEYEAFFCGRKISYPPGTLWSGTPTDREFLLTVISGDDPRGHALVNRHDLIYFEIVPE